MQDLPFTDICRYDSEKVTESILGISDISVRVLSAPQAGNKLPMELKLLWSTDLFRRDLKTFLFHSVYGHQDTHWLCDASSVF